MQNRKGKYEKVLLCIAGVVALAVAGFLIWSSRNFNDQLAMRPANMKNEVGHPPKEQVVAALKRLSEKVVWVSPIINEKPVPLNKSIKLLRRGPELIDILVENPPLRPPFPNKYLVENNLPHIESPNLGDLDPDGDGFSTLEEFNKKTNPMDPKSHPPVTDKLFLKQRISHDYILKLNSSTPPFQIQRLAPEPKGSRFVNLNEDFGFDKNVMRFKALSVEAKTEPDPKVGGQRDVSELTVLDHSTNKEYKLIRNKEPTNLAEYEAEFEFALGGPDGNRTVKEGENFQIPGLGITYKVVKIEENSAVIAPVKDDGTLGPPLTISKR